MNHISGIYHLCDSTGICYANFNKLYSTDIIISYTLIATYIFHITQINILSKFISHIGQILAFTWITEIEQPTNKNYILCFYFIPLFIVVLKIGERIWKRKFIIFIKSHSYKNLIIGCVLLTVGILFGPLGLIKINTYYYWLYHSLLWHVPIMLSSLFILKTPTINNITPIKISRTKSYSDVSVSEYSNSTHSIEMEIKNK